ncbi:sugar phosphate nucleotidyltransferase, partial [Chloroflexota bacterium]
VESLAQCGIRNIVVVVGYKGEQVQDYLGSGEQLGVDVRYVFQRQQLGTAHAREVAGEEFLVLSGDNIIGQDTLSCLMTAAPNMMLVKKQRDPGKYGIVSKDNGALKDIKEEPDKTGVHLANTGIYLFSREIFDFIGGETEIPSVLRKMTSSGHKIGVCETCATWQDVVYPWDILRLNEAVLEGISSCSGGTIEQGVVIKSKVSIGKGSIIRANSYIVGPVVIGEGCEIGPSVCILPATTIGDNVSLLPFTEVRNSVIGSDVIIGSGSMIHDSVIDRGCFLKGHFTARSGETEVKVDSEHHLVEMGTMIGERCTIDDNVVVQPGIPIGTLSRIGALKVVDGEIQERSFVI